MLNKIKNNVFLKSVIILLFGGILGKSVGFILKIIITRILGPTGMGLYSMLGPLTSLFSVIALFSYPTTLSKIISKGNFRSKVVLFNTFLFSICLNIFLILLIIIFRDVLTSFLLKNNDLAIPLIFSALSLPFISTSAIIKGYFWGKQDMAPYMLSNFIEQISRFILIILFLDKIKSFGVIYAISFILFVNIIGEVISQIVMAFYFPKGSINFKELIVSKDVISEVLDVSLPSISSKLIGSFCYFLEPIIITNLFLYLGYSHEYILFEYGVFNGYSMSLLLLPQFFIQNMSTALVPEISKNYYKKNYDLCLKRIKQVILASVSIGSIFTLIILLKPSFFLNLIYGVTYGIDYIRFLSPFIILYYIEYPLINVLHALNMSKKLLIVTIIGSLIRTLSLILFSFLRIGMYSLVFAVIINLIFSTFSYYYLVMKQLKKKH